MRYWIGLGANLGDRMASLRRAADALAELGAVPLRSRVYSCSPVGGPPQPPYLNAALALDATLPPSEMLASAQAIERRLGRERVGEVRWGPRPIDIDLLLAGDRGERVVILPGLELPHPRLAERAFALAPLCDLDPTLLHPCANRTVAALLREATRGELIAAIGEVL